MNPSMCSVRTRDAQDVPRTLPLILERRVNDTPHKTAYMYLGDPAGPVECSYADLKKKVIAVAKAIQKSTGYGERVLLLYPPGLDFIYAFLGSVCAGTIAVPAPPPNRFKPERSLARLTSIVESARPTMALTTADMLSVIQPAVEKSEAFARLQWMATDQIPSDADEQFLDNARIHPIMMIQYTSGSTSDPKGAALSQENVLHNVAYFDQGWDHTPESILVNWLPAFHDLGLFYGILCPVWGGFTGIQMSPIDVIQRPYIWLKAVSDYKATHSVGPNFIYDLCHRKIRDSEISSLDLSRWKMALTAAEPVRAETLERFAERFAAAGFRYQTFSPGYGLSENTCKVAAVSCSEEATILSLSDEHLETNVVKLCSPGPNSRTVVGCGRPACGVEVVIVDPETGLPRGADEVGEIWISGPSVAHSYWEQPEATEDSLRAKLKGREGARYLRSGDLGFLHEGEVFITGRIKDLIIVRGTNHYPQDLEYTAQDAAPNIRPGCCAAFSYEEEGEERVALVAEVERRQQSHGEIKPNVERRSVDPTPKRPPASDVFDRNEMIAVIRTAISEIHGLRVHQIALIQAGTIPKTTSGKIQRQACKRALLSGRLIQVE